MDLTELKKKIAELPPKKKLRHQPWLHDRTPSAFPGNYAGTGKMTTSDLQRLAASHNELLEAACVMEIISRECLQTDRMQTAHQELRLAIANAEEQCT